MKNISDSVYLNSDIYILIIEFIKKKLKILIKIK